MTEDDAVGSAFELPDGTRVGQRYPASSTDSPVLDIKLPGERKNITVRVNPDADAPADEAGAPPSQMPEHDSASQRPDDLSSDANRAVAARLLLDELLQDMSDGVVPLSNLDSMTAYDYPSAPIAEKQAVVLSAVQSMLESGRVIVGHVVGGSEAYVDPWDLTVVQVMEVLHDWYVTHHDDPATWEWTTWFALTEKGEQVAKSVETPDETSE